MTSGICGHGLNHKYGCGSCHGVPEVAGARGNVGPSLVHFADRVCSAGRVRNTPKHLMHGLRDPQSVAPGNAMPNMGVSDQDACDLAAFLYTLR